MKPNQSQIAKSGFTLVELLLVMAIIGVLSSLALVVVNEAQYDARVSATQSRINMLDQIMRQKMEQIQERRMPIDISEHAVDRAAARSLRRRVKVEILDAEMPRLMWDIAYERAVLQDENECTFPSDKLRKWAQNTDELNDPAAFIYELADAAPSNALRFRFDATNYNYYDAPSPGNPPYDNQLNYPEGPGFLDQRPLTFIPSDPNSLDSEDFNKLTTVSEYLYLILQASQFNGISAIEAMGNRAFGDTDQDGFLEVVDSWGNPIGFQFEKYFENGDPYLQPNSLEPADLDTSVGASEVLDIEHIRVRFVSTGGRATLAQQSRELITN